MEEEKAKDLMMRCPVCLNLFPSGVGQMQDGFMACALCGAKYGTDFANNIKEKESPQPQVPVVEEKTEIIDAIIQEIYVIAAELTISGDKDNQTRGTRLRELIEQLRCKLAKQV